MHPRKVARTQYVDSKQSNSARRAAEKGQFETRGTAFEGVEALDTLVAPQGADVSAPHFSLLELQSCRHNVTIDSQSLSRSFALRTNCCEETYAQPSDDCREKYPTMTQQGGSQRDLPVAEDGPYLLQSLLEDVPLSEDGSKGDIKINCVEYYGKGSA